MKIKAISAIEMSNVLTLREAEIVVLICEGLSDSEIGLKLNISTATVRTHRKSILKKLKLKKTVLLVRYAFETKLIK